MAKKELSKTTPDTTKPLSRLAKILPFILIVCGIIGIIASVAITVEKFDLLKNPNYHPICNLNPIISCGSVMASKQASAFGFMNTYIGLLGFPVVVTIGAAMLAGAKFKRWFWLGMQVGLGLGILFAYWLLVESVYNIRALCPYCLSVDVALTVAFWYTTLYVLQQRLVRLPRRLEKAVGFVQRHHLDLLIFWFVIVIAVILQHFWYYFGQHI
jgi:uncharacterized membrane protein